MRTRILEESGEVGKALMAADALEPDQVAADLLRGIAEERFLILPHAEVAQYYATRAAEPDRWLAGMNHLQQKFVKGQA